MAIQNPSSNEFLHTTSTSSDTSSVADSAPSQGNAPPSMTDILAAFQGNIEPIRVPPTYRLGILLVTVVMIILPLIYLALTLLVSYIVYYHTVNNIWLIGAGRGRGVIMSFLLYLAPIIIGVILVLFMFKPLFSRPAKPAAREPLDREKEPLLFAFVERICAAVGAPQPKKIELDSQVNASASFRRGVLSMLGNDLVLTIGMPLVAGLTLREFAGVLAHEFGHFAQGAGMRLTYIIRTISHWFTRVVYERDEWDERLITWSESWDFRLGWIVYLARFFVWLTRRVLWVLMFIGHAVSGFMLRQMEFDADRHETRLVGVDAFESTMRNIVSLSVAARGAHSDLGDFYREGRLGDNFPKLIMHNINQFTPEVSDQIDTMMTQSKTSLFATHPSESDRIASARREDTDGIFQLEHPAPILLNEFEAHCEAVTWDYYQSIFGSKLHKEDVHDLDKLLVMQAQEQNAFMALNRYLQGCYRSSRSLPLPARQLAAESAFEAEDEAEIYQQLEGLRKRLMDGATIYQKDSALSTSASSAELDEQAQLRMTEFEEVAGQRLHHSLRLLATPKIAQKLPQATEYQQDLARLMPTLQVLDEQLDSFQDLAQNHFMLEQRLQELSQNGNNEAVINALLEQRDKNLACMKGIRTEFDKTAYPYSHAKENLSLGEFLLDTLPSNDDIQDIYEGGGHMLQSTARLRARLTGHLCLMAEEVEDALGFERLPEPADEVVEMDD